MYILIMIELYYMKPFLSYQFWIHLFYQSNLYFRFFVHPIPTSILILITIVEIIKLFFDHMVIKVFDHLICPKSQPVLYRRSTSFTNIRTLMYYTISFIWVLWCLLLLFHNVVSPHTSVPLNL